MRDYIGYIFDFEDKYFSEYATKSALTKGRVINTAPCPMRTEYQRDRDRIIHSKSFRRLKHKTQVFLSPEGDHYRTRLTHTLEVAQIARSVTRALRLNEDLAEAISLGHDLGHPPYGHAGERALKEMTGGRFCHNEQSLRMVDCLENDGKGMNLTFEVRDGILNHTSAGKPATLEGYAVGWSDRIAYINHDIDDAVRGGVFREKDIPKKFRDAFGELNSQRINAMITDMVEYSYGKDEVSPSPSFKVLINELRQFMFDNVYTASVAKTEEYKAVDMIKFLYAHFYEHPEFLPKEFTDMQSTLEQKVCDHISMMSDQYAVNTFRNITIPKSWSVY